jgi:hypothetical protein
MVALLTWDSTNVDYEAWHFGNCGNTLGQAVQARDQRPEVLLALYRGSR